MNGARGVKMTCSIVLRYVGVRADVRLVSDVKPHASTWIDFSNGDVGTNVAAVGADVSKWNVHKMKAIMGHFGAAMWCWVHTSGISKIEHECEGSAISRKPRASGRMDVVGLVGN